MIAPIRFNAAPRAAARADRERPQGPAASRYSASEAASQGSPAGQQRPVQAVASLDALVALQAVDSPMARRARASRRGKAILDDLDRLKLALLEGRAARPELDRIGRLVADRGERSGDSDLDSLIADIELRAEVEIAKRRG